MAGPGAPEHSQWIEAHRPSARHDLCSTSTHNISVADLIESSEDQAKSQENLALHTLQLKEDLGDAGNAELRGNLAALYSARSLGITSDNILITSSPNYAALSALLKPGDHVICQHPVDELLHATVSSLGAEVSLWKADSARKWQLDLEELDSLVRENTRLVIIQSPCDPTGAIVTKPTLESLIERAEAKGIWILADESYRPLFHSILPSSDDFPPSTVNMGYGKVVVTGNVRKAYSLAGIHAGWIATKDSDILKACRQVIRLTSTTASKLDQVVAAEAVSERCIHALLAKNIRLCQTNLDLVQGFVDDHSWACSWVKPLGGTTAMLKFHKMGKPVDAQGFCLKLLQDSGILLTPATECFGDDHAFRGYVRVAFGGDTAQVKDGLAAWKAFMEESFDTVPTVSSQPKSES